MARHRLIRRVIFIAAVCVILAAPAAAENLANLGRQARQSGPSLFGTAEFQAAALKALPQWNRVLAQLEDERKRLMECIADDKACETPSVRSLRQAVVDAGKLPKTEQIDFVNKFFNKWPYKLDVEVYGTSEYWAIPTEFMKRSGDCEDYSIAKFFVLRELGFTNEQMRIVVVMDNIRRIGHAVLAVYVDEDIKILDSLSDAIFSHTFYKHYTPQYSVNETSRWLHVPTPSLLTTKK